MRYIGSKSGTLNVLTELIGEIMPSGTFCDPFGGIAVVGQRFKKAGYAVRSGDILNCAHAFQVAKLVYDAMPDFDGLKSSLGLTSGADIEAYFNSLPPRKGWVYREFSCKRQFFTAENAAAIDGIRIAITAHLQRREISTAEKWYLRACLIDAADRVANTAGTYYAHLKDWTRKARQPFTFKLLPPVEGAQECTAELVDATVLAAREYYDVLYLDPPYNERDYAGYYHLPETIATGRAPRATGRSGVPSVRPRTSAFTRPASAGPALERLLSSASYGLLALHYSDEGLIRPRQIHEILSGRGDIRRLKISAPGYSTAGRPRKIRHVLYLVKT